MAGGKQLVTRAGSGFLVKMCGKLWRPVRKTFKTPTMRRALRESAKNNAKRTKPRPDPRTAFRGRIEKTHDIDAGADKLANRLGGRSSVAFGRDPRRREFDTISDRFVASTKDKVSKKVKQAHKDQAKDTFDAAVNSGRTPYFHFQNPPSQAELDMLARYARRYGVEPVIDTKPL